MFRVLDRMNIHETVAPQVAARSRDPRSGLETFLSAAILQVVDIKIRVRKACVGRRAGAKKTRGAGETTSLLSSLS